MQIVTNARADRSAPYQEEQLAVVSLEQCRRASELLHACPLYARTPLHAFSHLAMRLGVAGIFVKDESVRLGLSSFKALGGAYAVMLRSPGFPLGQQAVSANRAATFATATDGNHGISVAAGAWLSGNRSVCVVPRHAGRAYEEVMQLLGAKVIRSRGNYDSAVVQAAQMARDNGWMTVSDTTDAAFDAVTRDVYAGYGVMVEECVQQLADRQRLSGADAVTHVFIQGGVGGLAAAFAGGLWERLGTARPTFVIVEPRSADCLYQSASRGEISAASGDLETSMGMLSCGRPSRMAWTILRTAVEHFMTIEDMAAEAGAQAYAAEPVTGGRPTTPSGAAGLAGLIEAASTEEVRERIGLDGDSVVLAVCSEQPPDRAAIERLMSSCRQAARL